MTHKSEIFFEFLNVFHAFPTKQDFLLLTSSSLDLTFTANVCEKFVQFAQTHILDIFRYLLLRAMEEARWPVRCLEETHGFRLCNCAYYITWIAYYIICIACNIICNAYLHNMQCILSLFLSLFSSLNIHSMSWLMEQSGKHSRILSQF